jgi:quinol monooxygenase YgiN
MVILRQKMRSKPDQSEAVMAALAAIIAPARATEGVFNLDIARDLLDPNSFVATGIYEDAAALERQESAPEVHRAMAMFPEALAAPPDRTIYDASLDPALVRATTVGIHDFLLFLSTYLVGSVLPLQCRQHRATSWLRFDRLALGRDGPPGAAEAGVPLTFEVAGLVVRCKEIERVSTVGDLELPAGRNRTGAGSAVGRRNLPIRLPAGCVDCRDPYFAQPSRWRRRESNPRPRDPQSRALPS